MDRSQNYMRGFLPYALAALLIGLVGGFSTVLGPAFVQDMGLPYHNTTWTALAQAISTAACAPVLGKLGDVFGRKPTLLLGIAVFTLGNLLSTLASSLLFMMLARFVVGLGTAAISPVILSYIVTQFPPEATAKGFSLYMLLSSAAVVFGPSLGGILVERQGWRAMLWLCTAICGVTLLLCFVLPDRAPSTRRPLSGFDSAGAVLIFLSFGLILCIPSFGQTFGWSSVPFLWAALLAALSLALLGLAEWRAPHPILQGGFLLRRAFLLSALALLLTQGLMQANMTNLIVFVNYTQPENAVVSGYAISILYLGMSLGSVLIGPLADRFEPKNVLTLSFLLTAAGCALMLLFSQRTSLLLFALSLGTLGLGLGGNATIFLKVVLSGLSPEAAGAGTGTYGLFRDLAAPFGVAVLVPLFTNSIAARSVHSTAANAAVGAIRMLAVVELLAVAAGIGAVRLLPRVHGAQPPEKS